MLSRTVNSLCHVFTQIPLWSSPNELIKPYICHYNSLWSNLWFNVTTTTNIFDYVVLDLDIPKFCKKRVVDCTTTEQMVNTNPNQTKNDTSTRIRKSTHAQDHPAFKYTCKTYYSRKFEQKHHLCICIHNKSNGQYKHPLCQSLLLVDAQLWCKHPYPLAKTSLASHL